MIYQKFTVRVVKIRLFNLGKKYKCFSFFYSDHYWFDNLTLRIVIYAKKKKLYFSSKNDAHILENTAKNWRTLLRPKEHNIMRKRIYDEKKILELPDLFIKKLLKRC